MLLNVLGPIVAGIWLAVLGEWRAIGYGILGLFVSHFALAFAMAPSLLFALPAVRLAERGRWFWMYLFGTLGSTYMIAAIAAWSALVLWFFTKSAEPGRLVPLLIWSYGAATGPLAWMASKEQTPTSYVYTFHAQIGYVTMVLLFGLAGLGLKGSLIGFLVVMSPVLLLQLAEIIESRKQGQAELSDWTSEGP